ncbi:hypothetical protein PV08_00969 [Exophiala spinifera]|uniref:Uncharacterized protein n=1 Tax=Exophiala spinifera TaxID=91928 RepID=A0A0D2CA03_9EURO|nr:uncharacterized protein PV08_00969 [Exophiala spinifera]KIW20394.1 hypothetical protein PV08_00969 [Exophiala spinifera]
MCFGTAAAYGTPLVVQRTDCYNKDGMTSPPEMATKKSILSKKGPVCVGLGLKAAYQRRRMSGIAWMAIAMFAGVVVIIALVYLYTLKVRRSKERAIRKAQDDELFGGVIRNPISIPQ